MGLRPRRLLQQVGAPPADVNTSNNESIAAPRELAHPNTMVDKAISQLIENALDRLESEYRTFDRLALAEIFARRALMISNGALELVKERPKPKPKLSDEDVLKFRAHAAAHPWDKSCCTPSYHIKTTFSEWLGRGLSKSHIRKLPNTTLAEAYKTEVRRHPERKVVGLAEEPRGLPAGAARPLSARPIIELSEEEKRNRRQRNLRYQRDFVARKAKKQAPTP